MRWHQYKLDAPHGARARRWTCSSTSTYGARGFRNDGADSTVLANGTFLNPGLTPETSLIPSFGYDESAELTSDSDRRKFGLPPQPRMPDLDDKARYVQSALTRDADFIAYQAHRVHRRPTSCRSRRATSRRTGPRTAGAASRTAWTRRWPRSIRSCRRATPCASDVWNGPDGDVAIEIDYQPGHEYNLDRMVAGVKDSLDYFTTHYGPYQHKILRIVEFPRFSRQGGFAESFPNSVPFNEAIGFTAKVDDARSEGHRLSVLRDGARGRASVVGAPGGAGQRAGRASSSPRASPSIRR